MEKITANWDGAMEFTAGVDGHKLKLDASAEFGGTDQGPRPKNLLLVALAGCTGMDVASLAKKMRVDLKSFKVEVESEKSTEMPIYFTEITVIYKFEGDENDLDKIIKMATLSQERYCGVSYMLAKAAKVKYRVELNGRTVKEGEQ